MLFLESQLRPSIQDHLFLSLERHFFRLSISETILAANSPFTCLKMPLFWPNFKKNMCLFILEERKGGKRETIDVIKKHGLTASCTYLDNRMESTAWACALTQNQTGDLSVHRTILAQPAEPHSFLNHFSIGYGQSFSFSPVKILFGLWVLFLLMKVHCFEDDLYFFFATFRVFYFVFDFLYSFIMMYLSGFIILQLAWDLGSSSFNHYLVKYCLCPTSYSSGAIIRFCFRSHNTSSVT